MNRTRTLSAGLIMAALAGVPANAQSSRNLDATIKDRLGVTAYTLQAVAPIHEPAGGFAATLELGGRSYTADFAPFQINADGCVMVLEDGSPNPQVVPVPPSCTYRGTIRGVPGSMCSGSLIDGRLTAVLMMGEGLGSWSVLPLSEVSPGAAAPKHIVTSNDDLVPGPWRCAQDVLHAPPTGTRVPPGGPGPSGGNHDVGMLCEIAIEADYPYFQLLGTPSGVAQDISTVIANTSSYYWLSGTNTMFRVTRYVIRVTPQGNPQQYNNDDVNILLINFRLVWNNLAQGIARDAAHMFTGRTLNGSNVGLAYLSTVCTTPWAYGISQSRFTLQPGRRAALTAHELGHNFGVNHCDLGGSTCTPCWIMLTTLGSTTNQLTRLGCSTAPILSYANSRACLDGLGPVCAADFDGSGTLSGQDFVAFQSAYAAEERRADLDLDGRLSVGDFVAFQVAFAAGCQ